MGTNIERDISIVIFEIIKKIPESFENRDNLIYRLNSVVEDNKNRPNGMESIAWKDAHIIIKQELLPYLNKVNDNSWIVGILNYFSDGKWNKLNN